MIRPQSFESAFGIAPTARAQAPGRVNLIGEHTDYNGGLVLPAAISLRTRVWLRFRADTRVRGVSRELGPAEAGLEDPPGGDWLDYVRGVARILQEVSRLPGHGFDLYVDSDLPAGAGLSSSAALEVATALALAAAAGVPFRPDERPQVAELCRRAEVEFVGVPCGIMDPYAIACCGPEGALLLSCSDVRAEPVRIPAGLELILLDTGVRRSLRDGGYEARRAECRRALAAARSALGVELDSLSDLDAGRLEVVAHALDDVECRRARHVVTENARVRKLAEALRVGDTAAAGEALFASHDSLRRDYDVTWPEADFVVSTARHTPGVLGARMTGAGWGGCTLQLVESRRARDCVTSLTQAFRSRFGIEPRTHRTRPATGASGGAVA